MVRGAAGASGKRPHVCESWKSGVKCFEGGVNVTIPSGPLAVSGERQGGVGVKGKFFS